MKRILLALVVVAAAIPASAQPYLAPAGQFLDRSSGTVVQVTVSSAVFAQVDTPQMDGSAYVLIQSTDGTGVFGCSYESTASSTTNFSTNRGFVKAKREPGGGFYELEFRRWFQNLAVYCTSLRATANVALHVFQGR